MNNFTKTESLPKTGHVNEVCKEWLVREDSALAYKLQSQEINDFYKGNRFRNAVVREDFPTALHEQIKEKENAEKQVELYRRRLLEQEEHDKHVAKEIATKLERDLQEQQQREMQESEVIAQQMQEIYVNMPLPSRQGARDNSARPPPPRPAKASIQQHNTNEPSTSNGRYHHQHSHQNVRLLPSSLRNQQNHFQSPSQSIQLQQQHFSNTDCYVGLTVQPPAVATAAVAAPSRQKSQSTAPSSSSSHLLVSDATPSAHTQSPINQFVERSKVGRSPHALTTDNLNCAQPHLSFHQHQHQQSLSSISAESSSSASSAVTPVHASAASMLTPSPLSSSASSARRNAFEFINTSQHHQSPTASLALNPPNSPTSPSMHNTTIPASSAAPEKAQQLVDELIEYSDVADSIRRYDISAGADAPDSTPTHQPPTAKPRNSNFNRFHSPSHENLLRNDKQFQKLSPEKYDQLVGNGALPIAGAAAERHMQQHADDIELYVDPCDYASLKEIGLPLEEIKEMSKKLKQEQKDELLARRLQQMEATDGLTQKQRDRLLAIEAQDKELAKMLQEREKAKAKRAKEKARLRKNQQKDSNSNSMCPGSNGLHCGPLLPLPQDCMSFSKHSTSASTVSTVNANAHTVQEEQLIDVEAYSNPIDVINNQQRMQNGTLTNGSLTRDATSGERHKAGPKHSRDDDIYTLPVDSCRPGQRPASLNIGPESGHLLPPNSMTRSENYSLDSHDSLNSRDISPRINYSKSGTFDQSASPTPPYMPIQGTRRSNSSEDRKKRSKDKCTHQ